MNRRSFLFYSFSVALAGGIWAPQARSAETVGSALSPEEVKTLLELHNQARADVGVQPLEWSSKIASYAQNWADHVASRGTFDHSGGRYGENMAGASGLREAVDSWLEEKAAYRGGPLGANWSQCGHYTQMVWRTTRYVGCGKASGTDYEIWVCCYDPAGNVRGQKPY